ncbi:unnamed protein product [Meganyctiphanes norvegica]|uniref:N-acetyltransferase domain-containing protein n=1 Tax=Meganyctiphanes norvegica TaxID=48144 RepID=A0AAV2RQU0_MEGNR
MCGPKDWLCLRAIMEYTLLSEKDWDEVEPLIKNCFLAREPTCLALHAKPEALLPLFSIVGDMCMNSGCSYGARDTVNGSKLVGVMLNKIVLLENKDADKNFKYDGTPQEMFKIELIKEVYKDIDLFDDNEGVESIFEFVALTVDPEYKGKGISRKLVELSEEKGIELGCQLGKVEASNIITQHIWSTMDYKTFLSFDFQEYNKKKGKEVFDVAAAAPTTGWQCMSKRFDGK